jgi:hypothetical protein
MKLKHKIETHFSNYDFCYFEEVKQLKTLRKKPSIRDQLVLYTISW